MSEKNWKECLGLLSEIRKKKVIADFDYYKSILLVEKTNKLNNKKENDDKENLVNYHNDLIKDNDFDRK